MKSDVEEIWQQNPSEPILPTVIHAHQNLNASDILYFVHKSIESETLSPECIQVLQDIICERRHLSRNEEITIEEALKFTTSILEMESQGRSPTVIELWKLNSCFIERFRDKLWMPMKSSSELIDWLKLIEVHQLTVNFKISFLFATLASIFCRTAKTKELQFSPNFLQELNTLTYWRSDIPFPYLFPHLATLITRGDFSKANSQDMIVFLTQIFMSYHQVNMDILHGYLTLADKFAPYISVYFDIDEANRFDQLLILKGFITSLSVFSDSSLKVSTGLQQLLQHSAILLSKCTPADFPPSFVCSCLFGMKGFSSSQPQVRQLMVEFSLLLRVRPPTCGYLTRTDLHDAFLGLRNMEDKYACTLELLEALNPHVEACSDVWIHRTVAFALHGIRFLDPKHPQVRRCLRSIANGIRTLNREDIALLYRPDSLSMSINALNRKIYPYEETLEVIDALTNWMSISPARISLPHVVHMAYGCHMMDDSIPAVAKLHEIILSYLNQTNDTLTLTSFSRMMAGMKGVTCNTDLVRTLLKCIRQRLKNMDSKNWKPHEVEQSLSSLTHLNTDEAEVLKLMRVLIRKIFDSNVMFTYKELEMCFSHIAHMSAEEPEVAMLQRILVERS
jgi:hypothetical protein